MVNSFTLQVEDKAGLARELVEGMYRMIENPSHKAYYRWLLDNSVHFIPNGKPKIKLRFKPEKRRCYYNAQRIAIDRKDALYFEGYATSKGLPPLEHAWVVIGGKVLEVTWNNDAIEYYGVHVPTDFIREYWLKTEESRDVLSHYYRQIMENGDKDTVQERV